MLSHGVSCWGISEWRALARSIPVVLRDGGGCNDMGRLRSEERECLLPWVCAGQIRGGQALLACRAGHRMRGIQSASRSGRPRWSSQSLVAQSRDELIAGLHAAFSGSAADGLTLRFYAGRVCAAPIFSDKVLSAFPVLRFTHGKPPATSGKGHTLTYALSIGRSVPLQ